MQIIDIAQTIILLNDLYNFFISTFFFRRRSPHRDDRDRDRDRDRKRRSGDDRNRGGEYS